jgi:hypothetical protein
MAKFKHVFTENSFLFRFRKAIIPLFGVAIAAFLIMFYQYCMPFNNALVIISICFVCVIASVTKSFNMSKYVLYEMKFFDAYKCEDVDQKEYVLTLMAYSTVLSFIHYVMITMTIFTFMMMSRRLAFYREEHEIEFSILIANAILGVAISILGFLFVRKTTRLFNLNPIKSIYSNAARIYYLEKDKEASPYLNSDGGLIVGDVIYFIYCAIGFTLIWYNTYPFALLE